AGGERARQNRQVLADELLLQVDGVGGADRTLAVLARPQQRGREVPERLAAAGPGLEQRDAAVVVNVRDVRRHVALTGTILEAAQRARDGAALGEQARDVHR